MPHNAGIQCETCIFPLFTMQTLDLRIIPWYYTEDQSYGKEATMQQATRNVDHAGVADTPQFHPHSLFLASVLSKPIKASLFQNGKTQVLPFFLYNLWEVGINTRPLGPANGSDPCRVEYIRSGVDA
jgi:hypothetical protein